MGGHALYNSKLFIKSTDKRKNEIIREKKSKNKIWGEKMRK